jgi:2'-hydroxyisoflavone reductase
VTGETYGALKALCEQEAEAAFPGRALIIRPGLIVGPHDPTDRFTYWSHRVAQGGELLAPGAENTPVQFIDVRDLAEWNIRLLESDATGIYNADGPQMPIKALLDACGAEHVTYVSEAFLEEQKVTAWVELPLWIPGLADKPAGGATDCRKALSAGLTYRPLSQTVTDTLAWDRARPQENAWKRTLTREREAEVLQAWHAVQSR